MKIRTLNILLICLLSCSSQNIICQSVDFSTFLRKHSGVGFSMIADTKGFIYIAGTTNDPNFPVTKGAYSFVLKGEQDKC
jgi:hypothetical protein